MRRFSWGLLDQAIASGSTALFLFAAAHLVSADEFGRFSLTMFAVVALTASCRGLLGMRIAILSGHGPDIARESAHALALALIIGALGTAGLLEFNAAVGIGAWLPALAATVPVVLAQDVLRFTASSVGRPRLACLADGVWASVTCGAVLLIWHGTLATVTVLVLTWLGGALVALGLLAVGLGTRPSFEGLLRWSRTGTASRVAYGVEALAGVTATFVVLALAAGTIGASGVAGLRGAATVFGVVMVLFQSVPFALVPELRSRNLTGAQELWRFTSALAIPISFLALALGFGSLAVPDRWGAVVLGATWPVTQPLLAITGVEYALLVWMNMANAALRAQDRAAEVLLNRLVFAGSAVVLGCGAGLVAGTSTMVAAGLAGGAAVGAVSAIWRLLAADRTSGQSTRLNSASLARRMSGAGSIR